VTLAIGNLAPDFALKDQNNQLVTLSGFRGRKAVLLVFYPLAFSRVCSGELTALRDDLPSFSNDRVELLTVSVDSVFAHKVWAAQEGFSFSLLSDFWPHGEVAQRYGVFDFGRGVALRGTFLIDTSGLVRHTVVNDMPTARDESEYRAALVALG
jgi:peroxiredoxin